MPSSRCEISLHFVWTTHQRRPLVTPEVERPLYACITEEAARVGCKILAIGGMPDHVHLAVWLPGKVAAAHLMQRVKGVSSTFARQRLIAAGEPFGWQEGYGVFSFSHSHRDRVISYICDQKRHHEAGILWTPWEAVAAPG